MQAHVLAALWHIQGEPKPLLAALQQKLNEGKRMAAWWEYAEELGREGAPLLPALRSFLVRDDEWLCVPAARVIWKATGSVDEVLPVMVRYAGPSAAGMRALECLHAAGLCTQELRTRLTAWAETDVRPDGVWALNDQVENDEAFVGLVHRLLALG